MTSIIARPFCRLRDRTGLQLRWLERTSAWSAYCRRSLPRICKRKR